jgi:hypothetical protein
MAPARCDWKQRRVTHRWNYACTRTALDFRRIAARAFERFSRVDGPRGPTGAGLGLAIVAAIARAHGGSVTGAKGLGGGADVVLTLRTAVRS